MSETPPREDERDSKDDVALRALLKRSVSTPPPPKEEPDILRGVQRKIRVRSRGKFYGDGWSTSGGTLHYVLVAAVMLVILAIAYLALGPVGISGK